MSIEESEVDFTHVEPLTDEERADVLEYCWHDVEATEELLLIERHGYLETKLHLGARAGLTPSKSLGADQRQAHRGRAGREAIRARR